MDQSSIIVKARWDQEAGVFTASSSDIDGLAIEAATLEELREKVLSTIPELMELNGMDSNFAELPVHILAEAIPVIGVPNT